MQQRNIVFTFSEALWMITVVNYNTVLIKRGWSASEQSCKRSVIGAWYILRSWRFHSTYTVQFENVKNVLMFKLSLYRNRQMRFRTIYVHCIAQVFWRRDKMSFSMKINYKDSEYIMFNIYTHLREYELRDRVECSYYTPSLWPVCQ